jgi:hypothetical protein
MEDSFWETSYNSSLQDEYYQIKQSASNLDFSKKQETLYNNNVRFVKDSKIKSGAVIKPFFTDLNLTSLNIASLPIFSDDSFSNTSLLPYKDYSLIPNELTIESSEEGNESAKSVNYLYYLNYKNLLNGFFNYVQPISYLTVFDNFRSDYEDSYLYTDSYNTGQTPNVYDTELN